MTLLLLIAVLTSLSTATMQSNEELHVFKMAAGPVQKATSLLTIRVGIITNYTGPQSYVQDIGALGLAIDRIAADQLLPNVQFQY